MDNINVVLGDNIRRFRKMMNLTQEDLADKIGVTYQAVSKWENAQSAPDISFLPLLADVFGCNIDDLFSRNSQKCVKHKNDSENIDLVVYEDVLRRAIEIALDKGRISTAMLQRKLGVSYNYAVRLIDELEQRGIIGPTEGISHARCVCSSVNDDVFDESTMDSQQ